MVRITYCMSTGPSKKKEEEEVEEPETELTVRGEL